MKKLLGIKEELDRILETGKCLIYGAGIVGKTITKYASQKEYTIGGVLVSNSAVNPHEVMGIRVHEITKDMEKIEDKILVVCVREHFQDEIEEQVANYTFKDVYYVSNKLFSDITYSVGNSEFQIADDLRREICLAKQALECQIEEQKKSLLRLVPKPCLEYLVLNILDHCNLRCKGCDHFACIADPYFVPYESICNDLERMASIFKGDYINRIAVMGGEPLLHPELKEILKAVRNYFPYTTIRLTTNGLLLLNQDEEFWNVCRDCEVVIVNTRYPINLNYEEIKNKAKAENVKFMHFEGTSDETVRKSFKKIVDLEGGANPVENFVNCDMANYGNFLMEGKLYTCPFSCQSQRIFNKKFDKNLRMLESDYLDIYEVKDMQEIFEFAARPKNYCRYCVSKRDYFDWSRSKQKISEWVEE